MCEQLHTRMATFSFLLQGIEQLRVLVLPARFGSASWSAQKQVLKDNQPLRITIVVPNRDGDSGPV